MTLGIMYPEMPVGIGPAIPYAELARVGGHRLWFGHSTVVDSHLTMAALAARGYTIPFGSAVALFPLWHPHGLAVQSLSVARLTGHTYVAGIGPGGREFQAKTFGAPFDKAVTRTIEFTTAFRDVVPSLLATHPSPGGREVDPMFGSVEVGYGVLRPAMARASGRFADWAITWLTPQSYLEEFIIPEMSRSAEEAERPRPRLATVVHVAVRRPRRNPSTIAFMSSRAHLRAPHYGSMLRLAGLSIDAADPENGADELVRSNTFIYGEPHEIVEAFDALRAAGVGEVIVNVYGVGQTHGFGAALEDLEEILDAEHNARLQSGMEERHANGAYEKVTT